MLRKLRKLYKKAINVFKRDNNTCSRTSWYVSYPSALIDGEMPVVRERVNSILKTSTYTNKKKVSFVDDSENQIKYYVPSPSIHFREFDTPVRKHGIRYEKHITPQIVITPPTKGENEYEVVRSKQVEKITDEQQVNPNVDAELDLVLAEVDMLIVELEMDAAALEHQQIDRHRNPPLPLDLDAISIGYHSQNGRDEDDRSSNSSGLHEEDDDPMFDNI